MSMYGIFEMDDNLEKKGVVVDYGSFRITLARAGGANTKFKQVLKARTRPMERAMKTDTLDDDVAMATLHMVYAESAVLLWENKSDLVDGEWVGEWVTGIEPAKGITELLPFTKENVIATFKALPELFLDVQEASGKIALFRKNLLEEELKN